MEVFTDKLVAKIPSTCTGIVKEVNYKVDEVCLVGHMLITIETSEDASGASSSSDSESSSED